MMDIVQELHYGRDDVARAVRLRAGKSYLECPMQHPYPLNLTCDITSTNNTIKLKSTDIELQTNSSEYKSRRNLQ